MENSFDMLHFMTDLLMLLMQIAAAAAVAAAVVFVVMLPLALAVWVIVRMFRGGGLRPAARQEEEETRMIQDLYHGFRKMEERVESLETILLDKQRKEELK